ncbi:ArsB/NhaD family transporter [Deinococcus psychrotolerans]|uniref:ArsB/NhaD family transporter n=1 Tax=Deinococcus psychrotolerans TaxID=2489213 RepID=UPI001F1534CE|nr:ArsB/NhaD family transporter [Deinococcus psychrotolerans]
MTLFAALAVFAATLFLVIVRPFKLNIALGAGLGASAALLLGLVQWADVWVVWQATWNATFTLIALIVLSLLLSEAGLFRFVALHLARWAGGNMARLFVLLILFGAVLAALLANDGAVLILTPVALELCELLELKRPAGLALLFATGFIVDAASLPLITSNLTNLISADQFKLGFAAYVAVMGPVNLAAVAAGLAALWWRFHKSLPAGYAVQGLPAPNSALQDTAVCGVGAGLLAALLISFFLAPRWGIPESLPALLAAAALLLTAWARGRPAVAVLKNAPWSVVVFSLGMYLVVYGLRNAGVTDAAGSVFAALWQRGSWALTYGLGGLMTLASAVSNNLPALLIGALGIEQAKLPPHAETLAVYANIVAANLGSKLTPLGSLATLLWLRLLAARKWQVSWGEYLRLAWAVTLPTLLLTLCALVLLHH